MRYGIPSYTVVGAALDGELYCLRCLDVNDDGFSDPIFVDDITEDDCCSECGDSLHP